MNSTIGYTQTDTGVAGTFSDLTTQGGASGTAAAGVLPTADGTTVPNSPALKTTLSLSGNPDGAISSTYSNIGSVSIALTAGE